ncbi:hypothetical protein DFH09DRAFT_1097913 [Mycena vulgaris]|nr:hypothetical protein DFH09DRAFT_1097913 [Mycena vulgaris]
MSLPLSDALDVDPSLFQLLLDRLSHISRGQFWFVAGAIDDGGEIGSGVVETAIKKRDARSALILRNRQNTYSGKAADWIRTLGLVPTPELEAILSAPLISLMAHPGLSDIPEHECHTRVMGVGSVLLQLLAVQHKLKEPLDLNGDLIEDLLDNSVVPCRSDGDDAFNVMFAALESSPAKSGVLVQQMLKFKRDHTVFDEKEFQPPTFRRDRPSHIQPNIAIPVVVGGVLKCKAWGGLEDEKSAKRANTSQKERKKNDK